jgi:pimeloyl-ACP methyl ester carboxylesterase
VNAAAGVHEVRPLIEHYAATRRVYAPDLPGFGASERPAVAYTPALMTAAIEAVAADIARTHGAGPLDGLAVSLSCEFLARAALAAPPRWRSLALVSPTGFSGTRPAFGPPGSTRALPRLHALLAGRRWSRALFDLLTSRGSVRFFLRKTWGRREIDERMFEEAVACARAPGAEHAPLCFLCGMLFGADIGRVYQALRQPVWMVHGTRGDFVDYRQKATLGLGANWTWTVLETGALPHFERTAEFCAAYSRFLAAAQPAPVAGGPASAPEATSFEPGRERSET